MALNLFRDEYLQGLKQQLACVGIIVLASLLLLWQSQHRLDQQADAHFALLLDTVADTLKPMIVGNDRLAMQRTLDTLADGTLVAGVRLLRPDGTPLVAAGDPHRAGTDILQRPLVMEKDTIATLELAIHSSGTQLPWLPLVLLAGAAGALVMLSLRHWQALQHEAPRVTLPEEPATGLQWPAWLDNPHRQSLLCVAIGNYTSLQNSLSASMLAQQVTDTLDLLQTLPGNALVPMQPLGAGRFALVFGSLATAVQAAHRLAAEVPPMNQARKAEGLLTLRLQACLLLEPDGNELATADRRWSALQAPCLSLLELASLCEANEILLETDTADAIRALHPGIAVSPITGEQEQVRAWRWQAA